jgi:hypothetical protein
MGFCTNFMPKWPNIYPAEKYFGHNIVAESGTLTLLAYCPCVCIPLSLLGNGSVKIFPSLLDDGSVETLPP